MKKMMAILSAGFLLLCGCAQQTAETQPQETEEAEIQETPAVQNEEETEETEEEMIMKLYINDIETEVKWEDNAAVQELKNLVRDEPLYIETSAYGGWEQVGDIGHRLSSNDVRQTAQPGDIMLYTGSQMVLFYGNNTWAYTKLGTMVYSSDEELRSLLDVPECTIKITME